MAILGKVFTVFLLLFVLLAAIIYIAYYHVLTVEGYYMVSITAEKPIEKVVLELPVTEDNEPIYKIREMKCIVKSNGYVREVKPKIIDTVEEYPKIISLPISGEGKFNIVGKYVLEEKLIDYSKHPWTLTVNSEKYEVPVYVEKTLSHK